MAASTLPRGLIIDLITPLLPDGGIDRPGLRAHLERVVPHAQGVSLCGPGAGAGLLLNSSRRREIFEEALQAVAGRVPLFAWITARTTEDTTAHMISLQERLDRIPCEGEVFWVDTPLFHHSNRGLPQYYRQLSGLTGQKFVLFNDPKLVDKSAGPLKRNNIRTAVLKEIAQEEAVQGLFFRGGLDRAANYQKAVRGREGFRVFDGDERQFLSHPSRHGVLSPGANLAPGEWQKVTASSIHTSGGPKAYPDYLKQVWQWGAYLESLRSLYAGNQAPRIRAALARLGVFDKAAGGDLTESDSEAVSRLVDLIRGQ